MHILHSCKIYKLFEPVIAETVRMLHITPFSLFFLYFYNSKSSIYKIFLPKSFNALKTTHVSASLKTKLEVKMHYQHYKREN